MIIIIPVMHGSSGPPSFTIQRDLRYCKSSIIQQAGSIASAKKLIVACLALILWKRHVIRLRFRQKST